MVCYGMDGVNGLDTKKTWEAQTEAGLCILLMHNDRVCSFLGRSKSRIELLDLRTCNLSGLCA